VKGHRLRAERDLLPRSERGVRGVRRSTPLGGLRAPAVERRGGQQHDSLDHVSRSYPFVVLYPNEALIRLALRGAAAYGLAWFDAHMWAYAEHYGLAEMWSEDFPHGRLYGTVRVVNPFS
jgi:predicted nucleic acid-binding protein